MQEQSLQEDGALDSMHQEPFLMLGQSFDGKEKQPATQRPRVKSKQK